MKTIRRLKWIMIALLLCSATTSLEAQTLYGAATDDPEDLAAHGALSSSFTIIDGTAPNKIRIQTASYTTGNYDALGYLLYNSGGDLTITINTTQPVLMKGYLTVRSGTVHVQLGDNFTSDRPALQRYPTYHGHLFYLNKVSPSYVPELEITGKPSATYEYSNNFVIDGGAIMHFDSLTPGQGHDTIRCIKDNDPFGIALIGVDGGTLDLDYVTLRNNWGSGSGAALYFASGNKMTATLDDCLIEWCHASNGGPAIMLNNSYKNGSTCVVNRSTIRYCDTSLGNHLGCGGAVRTIGMNQCTLNMTDCVFHHNYAAEQGGAIHWNAATIDPMEIHGCLFYHNWSGTTGGAVRASTGIIIEGCTFIDNIAETNGGAISFGSYTGGGNGHIASVGGVWYPTDGILDLDSETVFRGNKAKGTSYPYYFPDEEVGHGGAIHVFADFVTMNGYWATYLNNNYEPYKLQVNLNGATFENNQAQKDGGAVYMIRNTDFYGQISDLNFGTISGNTAGRNGGAFYLTEDLVSEMVTINYNYSGHPSIPGWPSTRTEPTSSSANGLGYYNYVRPDLPGTTYHLVPQPIISRIGTDIAAQNPENKPMLMKNNAATNGSGIYVESGDVYVYGNAVVGGAEEDANICTGGNGGAVCVSGGNFTMESGMFSYNKAKKSGSAGGNGGGFHVTGGTVTIHGGNIDYNEAEQSGGAFYVDPGAGHTTTINNDNSAPSISHNQATQGGAVYANSGDVVIYGATISNNGTTGGHGGAFDIANGDLTVSYSSITDNSAPNGNGGGAFVGNGNVVFNEGTTVTGNTAKNGGGICVDGGVIRYNDGTITGNTATVNGGGIYVNAGSLNDTTFFRGGTLSKNTAVNGGGVYINGGTLDFTSGTFSKNHATSNGGGIYVKPGAMVLLSGNATITKNMVPETSGDEVGRGGGIYLGGQVKVGRNAGDAQGTHSLKVEDNYSYIITAENDTVKPLNNIFLPTNDNVIELLSDVRNSSTKVGFSVNNGFRKVVYHNGDAINDEDASWLHGLLTEGGSQGLTGVIFDDSRKYMAVHVLINDQTFDHNYIYLWGCWISAVDKDPQAHLDEYPLPAGVGQHYTIDVANDSTWHIYTKEGLAWLCSSVNGLNGCKYRPDTKAVMERDVDMSDFLWVPLGSAQTFDPTGHDPTSAIFTDGHEFSGSFDGKGHVISGLDCRYINSIHNYGLFGDVVGDAKISNVLVDDFRYNSNQETGTPTAYVMGGIAGRAGGNAVISNCEARGVMTSPVATTSIMGGIVGVLETGGTVHSCIGIPTIQEDGLYKGGIAGQTEAGTFVMNSFANASFPLPTGLTYVPGTLGGLVGENSGTVENCYARVQGGAPNDDTHFGWLVGANATSGQVNYCYSPANDRYYHEGENAGTLTGCGHYEDDTQTPYLYARRDNQVDAAPATVNNGGTTNTHIPSGTPHPGCVAIDQQMLICLNNWVTEKNSETGTHPIYAEWQRPTTKVINDDLPLPMMTGFDAVAATNGDAFLNYGLVNTLLDTYKGATQAVWLYRNKDGLAGNASSSAKLYIAPNVAVKQSATVNAYVGVMLDNSAGANGANATFDGPLDYTDWHMFSSPLVAAPLGINYVKTDGTTPDNTQWGEQFEYGHPSGMPYYLHTGEGYFPTHRYGTSLPANNGDPTASGNEGNYYQEWDFYTYYEPEYHWINFKRNSNSHWHENEPTAPLAYTHYDSQTGSTVAGNETYLTRGRGYLLATREETFLQCSGQLTDGDVTIPVTVDGAYSPGYNFLGNPYLSYLNFDEFITQNTGNAALFGSGLAGYAIIDEDPVPGETPEHAAARGGYKYYTYNNSANTYGATKYIAPHQGFMILAANAGTATFTNDMREADIDRGHFRGTEQPAYALVNLLAYDGNGNRDITTVELGRPDKGGLPLMRELKLATCHVYSRYDDEDWTIAFTQPGISEVPVRFEAYADGEYTLRWNTQNGEFHYLHLIDNMTGTDIDCLTTDEYRFASTTTDYKSRFRLVFGYTGIEEPEGDGPSTGSGTFAYQSGDELVVTGEGTVELFDVTGRRMATQRIEGVQGTMSVSGLTPGVYLLRLATKTGTRVQKIVINQ